MPILFDKKIIMVAKFLVVIQGKWMDNMSIIMTHFLD